MREGPLAELFRATEAAQRQAGDAPSEAPLPPKDEEDAQQTLVVPAAQEARSVTPERRQEAALEETVEHVYEFPPADADEAAAETAVIEPEPATEPVAAGWRTVALEGVALSNPGRGAAVLDGFGLRIERGEVVALVGESGAGKSTVAALLLGLREPDRGHVLVDGADLTELDLRAWRQQVAWLPQRPTVFRGTVRANIALGDPGASDAAIEDASVRAGFAPVVAELPDGYDTVVGEGGRVLSAGETRRLALARALVGSAPLLILDEPTANLDPESAAAIAASIRTIDPDRAVLVIAHDPELALAAGRIVRLEHGRVGATAVAP
jgi:ABC-type multidrug transport system fused ATPase/permease subunit